VKYITVWLPLDLLEWIDREAERHDLSRNKMVVRLLKKMRKADAAASPSSLG